MKITYLFILLFLALSTISAQAQTDTLKTRADTIKIGGMIIINKGNNSSTGSGTVERPQKHKSSNVSTSELIVDFGFTNWSDKSDYATATAQQYLVNRPGQPLLNSGDLKLRAGKSSNVNIWFVMQRMNLIKHYVNLKYGLGIELNNYRFSSPISFKESGPNPYLPGTTIAHPYILRDSISFSKDKIAADYATVPFMINFQTNPDKPKKGLSVSAGVSVGYLYNSRNKEKSSERGKRKNHGEYGLEQWKFSYIGELGIGSARVYGSYTPSSIFVNGFSITPYSVGIRFSNW